jgi:SAM-dependent methyltransferase
MTALNDLVGERTVPQLWHENYWFRRHQAAYLALAPRVAQQVGTAGVVVEAGSGEGYGVQLLRRAGAEQVVALDYDGAALTHARTAYPQDVAGRAVRTNLTAMPLSDGAVTAIVCLQVIEHLWTPDEFLVESHRVLAPGGLLVVSTPNRLTFSPGLGRTEKPPNPFHCREFDAAELTELIADRLDVSGVLGVRHGPRLRDWQQQHGDLVSAQLATTPQQWPSHVRDLVHSVTAADFVLGPIETDDVLDLVVLAHS